MALNSSGKRLQNYTYGVNPLRLQEDISAKKGDMVARASEVFNRLVEIEDRVRGVLSGEAVVTMDYAHYHAFAREVYKLQRRFGGGTGLVLEVALLVDKWTNRGLTESVLGKIRDEVFAIPAPPGP